VVIGASLGGTEALRILLGGIRSALPVPIVAVVHQGPAVSRLDVVLGRASRSPVVWAEDGAEAEPGRVYLCPGRSTVRLEPDGTLTVRRSRGTSTGSVDELFSSAAVSHGPGVLAVVLTGTGRDGAVGCRSVRLAGGTVIAQDEATSAAFGMPSAVIEGGDASLVVPLGELPEVLDQVVGAGRPLPTPARRAAEAVFGAGGEMGSLMAAVDWSATTLGPVERWSPTLRTVLSMMLSHPIAMNLLWGRDRFQLYNDACINFMADYHPAALGRPMAQTWTEAAAGIETSLREVDITGEAALFEDQLFVLHRTGCPEEVYVTSCYSPVRDDGHVVAVLGTWVETTKQVLAHRRLTTLRRLAAIGITEGGTDARVCEDAVSVLAGNPHDVPFALVYLLDLAGSAYLAAATGLIESSPALLPVIDRSTASAWPLHATMVRGEPRLVDDLQARFPGLAAGPWPQPPDTALILPVGQSRHGEGPAAMLIVGVSSHGVLDSAYRQFLDLVADQIGATLTASRARRDAHDRIKQLAELNRTKTEFFANVSHEFRTPLTLMLLPLEQLGAGPGLALPAEDARQVHRNTLRLLRLVNNLLSFAELEQSRVRPALEAVDDLAGLTADLASVFRSAMERAGLSFTVDCPPLGRPVQADPQMWETIVLNLVSNAFKHTFTGDVTVRLIARSGHAELVVADTGTGITEEEIPHLFTRFHRVQGAKARSREGSGIGLALVQQLVQLHHGSIRVRSTPGAGSTFTVWVPYNQNRVRKPAGAADRAELAEISARTRQAFAEEADQWLAGDALPAGIAEAAEPLGSAFPAPGTRSAVLVVDDNGDLRRYLRGLLADRYDIRTAADGAQALHVLAEHPADLVLADVMLPELDGLELIQRIRTDPALRATPVILLTALAAPESVMRALAAGAHDYIVKPFTARELIARIESQLALARLRAGRAK